MVAKKTNVEKYQVKQIIIMHDQKASRGRENNNIQEGAMFSYWWIVMQQTIPSC